MRNLSRPILIGVPLIAVVTGAAWFWREPLHRMAHQRPAMATATVTALSFLLILFVVASHLEDGHKRRELVRRVERVSGIERAGHSSAAMRWKERLPDPLDWIFKPAVSSSYGQSLARDWADAGWGTRPSRAFLALAFAGSMGVLVGIWIGSWMLGVFLGPIAILLARRIITSKANSARRKFGEQLPHVLDSLASGLSAGLTFQQAVRFASEELPEPASNLMRRLHFRMDFGHPVENALSALGESLQDETLDLAIDGIVLQRQFGGNVIAHLQQAARLLRDRLELQQEVQSITAQGRLSGWVIGALVPVSAAILLASNPQYADILFETVYGQLVLITVVLLQIIGWTLISRLIRIRY